jgi:hypothetical protein
VSLSNIYQLFPQWWGVGCCGGYTHARSLSLYIYLYRTFRESLYRESQPAVSQSVSKRLLKFPVSLSLSHHHTHIYSQKKKKKTQERSIRYPTRSLSLSLSLCVYIFVSDLQSLYRASSQPVSLPKIFEISPHHHTLSYSKNILVISLLIILMNSACVCLL